MPPCAAPKWGVVLNIAQRAARRVVVATLVAAILAPGARLLGQGVGHRYPYLQSVDRNRAIVMWTFPTPGSGVVQYSTDKSYSRSATAQSKPFPPSQTGQTAAYTQYEAELTGLAPNTTYFYRATVDGRNQTPTDELSFRTAGPGPFSFLVFGDTGQATTDQLNVATRMSFEFPISGAGGPALVLHTGDIAYYSGTFDQFENNYFGYYFNMMRRVPFFPAPGNHEYVTPGALPFLAVHSMPAGRAPAADRGRYYSFDWGNVHFICLDSNDPLLKADTGTGKMFEWLEDDLQRTTQFWRVAYWHHPPYASGPNSSDPGQAFIYDILRNKMLLILERHGVQLVFNGHEHSYQRSRPIRADSVADDPNNGILYITTGGGGAGLYPVYPRPTVAFGVSAPHYVHADVQGGRMTLHAIGVDGVEIDPGPVVLAPKPVITTGSGVNAASFVPSLAPGSLVSLFGKFLAFDQTVADKFPLSTQMGGATVTLNGRPLPLLYVSSGQINTQFPFNIIGSAALRVTTLNGFSEVTVNITQAAPGIFFANQTPIVVHSIGGALVTDTAPARPGEFVTVYMTGLGAVTGNITEGQPAPDSPLLRVQAAVIAKLGTVEVQPSFAGLTPGLAGLYQVNLQIPAQLPSGTYPLGITVAGVASNAASVPVRSN